MPTVEFSETRQVESDLWRVVLMVDRSGSESPGSPPLSTNTARQKFFPMSNGMGGIPLNLNFRLNPAEYLLLTTLNVLTIYGEKLDLTLLVRNGVPSPTDLDPNDNSYRHRFIRGWPSALGSQSVELNLPIYLDRGEILFICFSGPADLPGSIGGRTSIQADFEIRQGVL